MVLWSTTDKTLSSLKNTAAPNEAPRLFLELLHPRQRFELVERRRRGQRPFQRGGAGAPRIVGSLALAHERFDHAVDEDQHAKAEDVGADRGDQVPAGERIGIVDIAARHAGEAEEM